jgi:uncharacterized membrane protein YgaE (UPF0421/DUF939 family)
MARRMIPAWLRGARGMLDGPRVALAARTAVAAAVAWLLAPHVPFAAEEYSYYAPLGVLVSVYPTIARSARSGAETLAGLALGIALGFGGIGLVWLGVPGALAVGLLVGVGVLLGGLGALGVGREWVAMSGLFVLLLGGPHPEDFSVSYLVTMAFGVAVGVLANLILFPPLYLQRAGARLSALRDALARHLHDMADAVATGEVSPAALDDAVGDLGDTVVQVAEAVRDAHESSTANPRARGRTDARERNRRHLRALERTVFSTRDLADVLARAHEEQPQAPVDAAPSLLAEAIHRAADLVAQSPEGDAATRLDAAVEALDRYTAAVDASTPGEPSRVAGDLTAVICLRRIVDAARPFA